MNFLLGLYTVSCSIKLGGARSPQPSRQKGPYLMSIQEVSAEQLAELFHHYHQALAPDFGCHAEHSPQPWNDVPSQERGRMTAAARLALIELESMKGRQQDRKNYFAKPGEAEWGC